MAVDIDDGAVRRGAQVRGAHLPPGGRPQGLQFEVDLDTALPPAIQTDAKRLQQVLKNLLSNAFKFTERGSVSLRASVATEGWNPEQRDAERGQHRHRLLGDRHRHRHPARRSTAVIFEAFQQGDGTTSRKYGGTGLGLSISRQITRLLGGEIRIESTPGEGSTFTLYLPLIYPAQPVETPSVDEDGAAASALAIEPEVDADGQLARGPARRWSSARSATTGPPSRRATASCSIAEDDPNFAQILLDLARERGFKGLVAQSADRALAAGSGVPAHRRHARPAAARCRRLDHPGPAQARPRHPAHPGAHHLGGGELAARAPAGRDRLHDQAGHQGIAVRGAHHAA